MPNRSKPARYGAGTVPVGEACRTGPGINAQSGGFLHGAVCLYLFCINRPCTGLVGALSGVLAKLPPAPFVLVPNRSGFGQKKTPRSDRTGGPFWGPFWG